MPEPKQYLYDPEEYREPWFEPIEADDDELAEEACQDLANGYSAELTDVRHQYDNRYDCYFE